MPVVPAISFRANVALSVLAVNAEKFIVAGADPAGVVFFVYADVFVFVAARGFRDNSVAVNFAFGGSFFHNGAVVSGFTKSAGSVESVLVVDVVLVVSFVS